MKRAHLLQCKKVIINNKKSNKYIKLSFADKLALYVLTKKLKKEKNLKNLKFEEFVLLCKHNKTNAMLRLESKYSTMFIDLLTFDQFTLRNVIIKIINDIESKNEESEYKNLESIIYYIQVNNVILFDYFTEICEQLKVKITIE
jgi:hypothetical protein